MSVKKIGAGRIILNETDSTNNYAMELIRDEKAENGMVIITPHQTSGKGQRGKTWVTPPNTAITFSYLLEADFLPPHQSFQLLAATAVALRNWAAGYLGEKETKLKWPNDLYWGDRKAGGILIENVVRGKHWKWAVIGMGINILQTEFPSNIGQPVSFLQATGKQYNIETLTHELILALETALTQLKTSGFENIYTQYQQHLWKKGASITLQYKEERIEGKLLGVDTNGLLQVNGEKEFRFHFQDISWVI